MAKGKSGAGVQNRAIYSRISFLQQAAVALASVRDHSAGGDGDAPDALFNSNQPPSAKDSDNPVSKTPLDGMSRRLATDLRAVSLKTRIRLKPAVKQTICKFCDSILIDGVSCTSAIENKSKASKKPWADILVRKCHTCGRERRYPVSAPRPKRKTERGLEGGGGHSGRRQQKG